MNRHATTSVILHKWGTGEIQGESHCEVFKAEDLETLAEHGCKAT